MSGNDHMKVESWKCKGDGETICFAGQFSICEHNETVLAETHVQMVD